MRISPGQFVSVLAAFAVGYAIPRMWRSSEARVIAEGLKPSFLASKLIASASSSAGTPAERLIALCEQPGSLTRDHQLFEAIQAMNGKDFLLAVADFPSLVQRFEKLPPELRHMMAQAAIERWLESDAEGAKRWLGGAQSLMKLLPAGHGRELDPTVLYAIVPALTRNDPSWCRAQLDKFESKPSRQNALSLLLTETARTDPGKARAMFAELTDPAEINGVLGGLAYGLAESDPQSLAEVLRGVSDPGARANAMVMAIHGGGKGGASAMRDLLSQIDDPKLRSSMIRTATISIVGQSSSDPFAFFDEQLATVPEAERDALATDMGVIRPLVSYDADRAAEMIGKLQGKARDRGIQGVLQFWSERDPAAAVKWLSSLPPETLPVTSNSWDPTLTRLANRAPAEFEQWVGSLPGGDLQDRSRVLLATRFAEQGDVAQAVRLFQQSAASSMSGNTAVTFGRTIASQDPTAAAACVAQLPPGRTQSKAAEGVAAVWSVESPQAAAAWVAKLPEGQARDSATGALANSLVYADPGAASEWIGQIRDPAVRTRSAIEVFRIWSWEDPAKAREWLRGIENVQTDRINALLNY